MVADPVILNAFRNNAVLVVDDEKFSRSIAARHLEPLRVVEASDGLRALQEIQAGLDAGLVICDFNMPGMDGLKFLKSIRSGTKNVRNDIPIMMLTGSSDSALVKAALELDVDGFLIKPVSKYAVEERIKYMLTHSRDIKPPSAYADIEVDDIRERLLGSNLPVSKPEDLLQTKPEDTAPAGACKLALADVPPNSILAVDIKAPSGELLVGKGVPLSERLLRRLQDLAPLRIAPSEIWIEE